MLFLQMGEALQYKFDLLVKENIVDFEMSIEEAVTEALESFKKEKHNSTNLYSSTQRYNELGEIRNVRSTIAKFFLDFKQENFEYTVLVEKVKNIQVIFDNGLSERIIAWEEKCLPFLLRQCKIHENNKELMYALINCITSLITGQPDIVCKDDIYIIINLLEKYLKSNDDDLLASCLKCLEKICNKHEINRNELWKNSKVPIQFMQILTNFAKDENVIIVCCRLITTLLTDDDIRVEFGKSSDRAKEFVESGMLVCLLKLAKEYKNNKEIFGSLSKLSIRNEFCQQVLDNGGVSFLLDTVKSDDDIELIKSKLSLLKAVSGNDESKIEIGRLGGIECLLDISNKFIRNAQIANLTCITLASVVLRQNENCKIFIENNGDETLKKILIIHLNDINAMISACLLIRNVISRCKEFIDIFLSNNFEELLKTVNEKHKVNCGDYVKAALRDLGCKVHLKEEWKGEGRDLIHD